MTVTTTDPIEIARHLGDPRRGFRFTWNGVDVEGRFSPNRLYGNDGDVREEDQWLVYVDGRCIGWIQDTWNQVAWRRSYRDSKLGIVRPHGFKVARYGSFEGSVLGCTHSPLLSVCVAELLADWVRQPEPLTSCHWHADRYQTPCTKCEDR